jgi:D-beta-D-heptose 7-phosphate kinase/D-beta-D-heptose 1-phosphate adenosyltransferase
LGLEKFKTVEELHPVISDLQSSGQKVVFTNGCFDILHLGHVRYLAEAATLGDSLVVAVNSDDSIRRLKGNSRPIQPEEERVEILCALKMVRFVTLFDDDTPLQVIRTLLPDVLVKGGDWTPDRIVGRDEVEAAGGRVLSLPFTEGFSTSRIIEKIRAGFDG